MEQDSKSEGTRDSRSISIEDQFNLPNNFAIKLLASEPDIINPMTLAVGDNGSIYVSESSTYRYGIEGAPSKNVLNPIKRIDIGPNGNVRATTLVAEGFANPVMGLSVHADKLYATCLNELFVMDISPDGQLTNRKLLVKDAAEPWNPFGMYRVIVGPDSKLWLAIADHPDSKPVSLTGSDGRKVSLRGQSGGFVRCNLDGSGLEVIVQGFRAPFSFDIDPWGHLWAISNGEGSPNIYVDVIPGMDYGYHSRDVSYAWLAGKTRLAPPVFEMPPGANTIALHYYSSMFPDEFWGSIFIGNWGSHGANPTNRGINVILQKGRDKDMTDNFKEELRRSTQLFLTSKDSLFRPVSMVTAPDGGLYLADWHSRDDDSNLIGRVFKISYTEEKQPKSENIIQFDQIGQMDSAELSDLLGNHNQSVREHAKSMLVQLGNDALESLGSVLRNENAFAAANAIWTLTSIDSESAAQILPIALKHPDARIRSLALRQLRQFAGQPLGGLYSNNDNGNKDTFSQLITGDKLAALAEPLIKDPDGEVRIEAALSLNSQIKIREGLLSALEIIKDKRLRYQIGFELGRYGDLATLTKLHNSPDPELRRVALIAAETARNENNELATNIEDWDLTLDNQNEAENLVAQIQDGEANPIGAENQLMVLNWLEVHPPKMVKKPLLKYFLNCLGDSDPLVQEVALRNIGINAFHSPEIKSELLRILKREKGNNFSNIQLEAVHSLGSFEDIGSSDIWASWLKEGSEATIIAALRSIRERKRSHEFMEAIWPTALSIAPRSPLLAEEVWYAFRQTENPKVKNELPPLFTNRPTNKEEIAKLVVSKLKGASSQRGRWSFSNECSTCHSVHSGGGESLLGPNLANIGAASQPQYLIESILQPSKVLKTGFQVGTVETKDGQVYSGQMATKNGEIVIKRVGTEPLKMPIADIKSRTTSHLSIMPEGLDDNMSTEELADLTAYLLSLKD